MTALDAEDRDLHRFMLREAAPSPDWLWAELWRLIRFPSRRLAAFDLDTGTAQLPLQGRIAEIPLEHLTADWLSARNRMHRLSDFVDGLPPGRRGRLVLNMQDCTPPDFAPYMDRPVNIFQYNRHHRNRWAVLWRLPRYFEPGPELGATFGEVIRDDRPFGDKRARIHWRGNSTGIVWRDPWTRQRAGPPADRDELVALAAWNSRARAVAYSLAHPDFTDFRYGLPRQDLKALPAATRAASHIGSQVPRSKMLAHRYLFCPAGNDVASQLYWVIGTNSIAFKEETPYEVVPDHFLKPWVHYVPVRPDLTDLRDKFDFCEANPDVCARIIEQANHAHARIRRPEVWAEAEGIVLERLGLLG